MVRVPRFLSSLSIPLRYEAGCILLLYIILLIVLPTHIALQGSIQLYLTYSIFNYILAETTKESLFANLFSFRHVFLIPISLTSFITSNPISFISLLNIILIVSSYYLFTHFTIPPQLFILPPKTDPVAKERSPPRKHPMASETSMLKKLPQFRRSFKRSNSACGDEESWIDAIDQGLILLDHELALLQANRKAQEIMAEFKGSFGHMSQNLREAVAPFHTLKSLIQSLPNKPNDGEPLKVVLSHIEDSSPQFREYSTFKTRLFKNYKVKIWKLKKDKAILEIKEYNKNANTTIFLADKLNKATIGTFSHEIKTILNGLTGNLELLREGVATEVEGYYRFALSFSYIVASKIQDFLDYIQIQNKELKLHFIEFSIDQLIKEVVSICKWPAKDKGLTLEGNRQSSVPQIMIGDKIRIKQILINIVYKTIELTKYGTVGIAIYLKKDRHICIKVTSMGSGMHEGLVKTLKSWSPAAAKRRLTVDYNNSSDPMQNLDELPMEISQLICREMGTKIEVKSHDTGYSYFKLVLFDGFPCAAIKSKKKKDRSCSNQLKRQVSNEEEVLNELQKNKEEAQGVNNSQHVQEHILKCAKVENINIINVNVTGSHHGSLAEESDAAEEAKKISQELISQNIMRKPSRSPDKYDIPLEFAKGTSLRLPMISPKIKPSNDPVPHFSPIGKKLFVQNTPRVDTDPLLGDPEEERVSEPFSISSEKMKKKMQTASQGPKPIKLRRTTTAESSFFKPRKFGSSLVEPNSGETILIVDDNKMNRDILNRMLKRYYSCNSHEAIDGNEAISFVEEKIIKHEMDSLRLILMDLQMPIMNGIEATSKILALCKEKRVECPPIIGVSSDPGEEDRRKFLKAGLHEFLNKPIDLQKLKYLMHKYLRKQSL